MWIRRSPLRQPTVRSATPPIFPNHNRVLSAGLSGVAWCRLFEPFFLLGLADVVWCHPVLVLLAPPKACVSSLFPGYVVRCRLVSGFGACISWFVRCRVLEAFFQRSVGLGPVQ